LHISKHGRTNTLCSLQFHDIITSKINWANFVHNPEPRQNDEVQFWEK